VSSLQLMSAAGVLLFGYCAVLLYRIARSATEDREMLESERRALVGVYVQMMVAALANRDVDRQRSVRHAAMLHGIDLDAALAEAFRESQ
jgi:hypothetical protein